MMMMSSMRVRNERLQVIEEEQGYRKGGKVGKAKKPKKAKKTRKATGKRKKTATKRSMRETMRYLPSGAMPTTGMGSVVFGTPQPPSYFRAVQPDITRAVQPDYQTLTTLPSSLKALEEGQTKTLKKLEYFEEEGKKQMEFNREVQEEFERHMTEGRKKASRPTVSVMTTPRDSPVDWIRQGFRPLTAPSVDTLDVLKEPVPSLPTTPIRPSPVPARVISSSYEGPLSSAEASQPYLGADASLPVQAPTSGEEMKPDDVVFDSPDSAFVPLNASAPESVSDAVDRASAVASSASSHAPIKIINVKRPVVEKPIPAPSAPSALSDKARWFMRDPDMEASRDTLNSMASALGISNPKKVYTGIGSTNRLREAIKEAQARYKA